VKGVYTLMTIDKTIKKRRVVNTTLNEYLYKQIRLIALEKEVHANELLEEGMEYIVKKYKKEANKK
jgi:hypothetical protein